MPYYLHEELLKYRNRIASIVKMISEDHILNSALIRQLIRETYEPTWETVESEEYIGAPKIISTVNTKSNTKNLLFLGRMEIVDFEDEIVASQFPQQHSKEDFDIWFNNESWQNCAIMYRKIIQHNTMPFDAVQNPKPNTRSLTLLSNRKEFNGSQTFQMMVRPNGTNIVYVTGFDSMPLSKVIATITK